MFDRPKYEEQVDDTDAICPYCGERYQVESEDDMSHYVCTIHNRKMLDRFSGWYCPLCEQEGKVIDVLKMVYRKHCLADDSIGWIELEHILCNTLCEMMGDREFQEWLAEYD